MASDDFIAAGEPAPDAEARFAAIMAQPVTRQELYEALASVQAALLAQSLFSAGVVSSLSGEELRDFGRSALDGSVAVLETMKRLRHAWQGDDER